MRVWRKQLRAYRAVYADDGWYVEGESMTDREVWQRAKLFVVLAGPLETRAAAELLIELWKHRQLAIQPYDKPPAA